MAVVPAQLPPAVEFPCAAFFDLISLHASLPACPPLFYFFDRMGVNSR
jgi:hypothetical protein